MKEAIFPMSLYQEESFQLLRALGEQIRARAGLLAFIGLVCISVGYIVAGKGIQLLLDSSFLSDGAEVVVLHPLEIVLLRLRIAGYLALSVVVLVLSVDVLLRGRRVESLRESASDISSSFQPLIGTALVVTISMIGLSALGLFYSFEFVIPMLLEYLTSDAESIGLTTTWQLEAWAGFIVSLTGASVLVFQTPLVILALLRTDLVSRDSVSSRRREIWFVTVAFSAFLSPPDPLSLLLIAMPVIVLMEGTLLLDSLFSGDSSKR